MAAETLRISCDDCAYQESEACQDCLVTYLLETDPEQAVVIDAAEARAVRLLQAAGLAPALRHARRAG